VVPLVTEAFNWQHGTFLGSIMGSETTAAAAGKIGQLRRDPFAMLPFCGYHMGDYFAHWLKIGTMTDAAKLPRLYYVNWFRQDANGRFLWPGYGENSRVLKWIFDRVSGKGKAVETPIGCLPAEGGLDLTGLDVTGNAMRTLLTVDAEGWLAEIPLIKQHYDQFGDRLPAALRQELAELERRLTAARK
jgi:phosphoenolpyruvate carboxykinase (GTP)